MRQNEQPYPAIVVFLRVPELGKVKTRLAATLGNRQALEIYRQLIQTTLKSTLQTGLTNYLYFYPFIDEEISQSHPLIRARTQKGDDLGEKMYHAFDEVLKIHDRVITIGTDCPYLSTEILQNAIAALDDHDIVLGPATDGGYYLIGLKHNAKPIFEKISWSTDRVLKETIGVIERLDQSYYLLPELGDVDFEADWIDYQSSKTNDPL